MDQTKESLPLTFFRSTPENLMSRPPLCSSLQSLETCFYLIALFKYPQALISCASSIESAMKSVLNKPQKNRIGARALYNEAINKYPALKCFEIRDLDYFRETRNRITHYGFSPNDDEETAILMLKTGIPFLIKCYKEFFRFDIKQGLMIELYDHLNFAFKTFEALKDTQTSFLKHSFTSFAHFIRWNGLRYETMSALEARLFGSDSYYDITFEIIEKIKSELDSLLNPNWIFDCPVCNETDSFICELDNGKLDNKTVYLTRGVCSNCRLEIRKEVSVLLNFLCTTQIEKNKSTILKEFGIV